MESLTTKRFSNWSRRLRQSDRAAYTELYNATHAVLYRYASYITRNRDDAYDVLHDVYMKLWTIRGTLNPDLSLKALLYLMVRNRALNRISSTSRTREVAMSETDETQSPNAAADLELGAKLLKRKIRSWVMELPERRREAFMLSRYEGLNHREIAKVMGLAPKTVNNHIVAALAHLRQRLEDYNRGDSGQL